MSSALQPYPQLSSASLVPVASEGWCSSASGEWISSALSVSMDSLGHQRAETQSWGITGSFSVSLFNQISRQRKNYKQKSPLLHLQVSRVKLFMGFAWWNFFLLGNTDLIKWNVIWACFHLNETCAKKDFFELRGEILMQASPWNGLVFQRLYKQLRCKIYLKPFPQNTKKLLWKGPGKREDYRKVWWIKWHS